MTERAEDADWSRVRHWRKDHPVVLAFAALSEAVQKSKLTGWGTLRRTLNREQEIFLLKNVALFEENLTPEFGMTLELAQRVLDGVDDKVPPSWLSWSGFFSGIAGTSGRSCPDFAVRCFVIAQLVAISLKYWNDPVKAIIFAAAQYAAHRAELESRGMNEDNWTFNLVRSLRDALEDPIIPALNKAKAGLPEGRRLRYCYAHCNLAQDYHGADFAIALGIEIFGKPMFRVALFQAKRSSPNNHGDVSQDDGDQLDEILSSGMGFYIFYPKKTAKGRALVPMVRSAESVFRDVWSPEGAPTFSVSALVSLDEAEASMDFGLFMATGMASGTDLKLGRLFPNADAVVDALAQGRPEPLAREVLFWDTTNSLDVALIQAKLRNAQFIPEPSSEAPWFADEETLEDDEPLRDKDSGHHGSDIF